MVSCRRPLASRYLTKSLLRVVSFMMIRQRLHITLFLPFPSLHSLPHLPSPLTAQLIPYLDQTANEAVADGLLSGLLLTGVGDGAESIQLLARSLSSVFYHASPI